MKYVLPIKPSPNLPNAIAVRHYPSLCFFEGTSVSVGRGTKSPFQMFGHPDFKDQNFNFKPTSGPGSKYPKHENKTCHGKDLARQIPPSDKLDLSHLIFAYQQCQTQKTPFFNDNNFFEKLAGTDQLRKMIMAGQTEEDIRGTWKTEIEAFKLVRAKYLMYE